jgi:hypothetical protein
VTRDEEIRHARQRKGIYVRAIAALEKAFRLIEADAPKPTEVTRGNHLAFRYMEPSAEAAIFLKLARLVSLVHGLELLIDHGRVQEQCILQRSIEETNEDIVFLCLSILGGEQTDRHAEFLTEFWKEDYSDPSDPVGSRIPRGYSRKGIRSYNNRALAQPNPSGADGAGRSIYEMYSGFLHGSAPHIMELFDENNGRFSSGSISGSVRFTDYILDAQNSFYRSLLSAAFVAKAFGLPDTLEFVQNEISAFIEQVGRENLLKSD